MKQKQLYKSVLFLIGLTLLSGVLYTMGDFYNMPFRGMKDLFILIAQFLVIEIAIFLFMWCIASNKYVFAILYPIYTLACSVATYFRYTAQISLTAATIDLSITNDFRTTMDVVTIPLILFVIVTELICIGIIYIRIKYIRFSHSWLQFILAFIGLTLYISIPRISLPIKRRIPFVIYFSINDYLDNRNIIEENRPAFKQKGICKSDSIDVVFIIGETLRSKNMQINGYHRAPTPFLMTDSNIVSMPHIYSEYGFTHTSVPYLLTRACPKNLDAAYKERSFIDIFKKAGFHTTWIANQESIDTYVYFMKETDSLIYVNNGKSVYIFDQWLDEDILPLLDKQIQNKNFGRRNLFILHTIGSHWWYNIHYTRQYARWKPELKSRVLSANTKEEFFNSYDNSVLYSDFFWNEVRNRFRNRNATIIYLSDHAESLGEKGIFGHGEEAEALHYPGCWIWMSNKYKANYPNKWKALQNNKNKKYNSAFLFHSILDAGDITTPYIDKKYDIFIK